MIVTRKKPRIIVSMAVILFVLFIFATLIEAGLTVYATPETFGAAFNFSKTSFAFEELEFASLGITSQHLLASLFL